MVKKTTVHLDWQFCLQIANNKSQLAQKILDKFIVYLDEIEQEITKVEKNGIDLSSLADKVHQLRGASCYCGVPNIKAITTSLEQALQIHNEKASVLWLNKLKKEMTVVKKLYNANRYRS